MSSFTYRQFFENLLGVSCSVHASIRNGGDAATAISSARVVIRIPERTRIRMFIREKNVKGVIYRVLVETYRDNGKVRRRVLYTLGKDRKTLAEAIVWERGRIPYIRDNEWYYGPDGVERKKRFIAQLGKWERGMSKKS